MIRVFSYARFSSDRQNDKSNADQHRANAAYAAQQAGWTVTKEFSDEAISGDARRPEFEAMKRAARNGECDVVLAEALDRFSRNLEDLAAFYNQLSFKRVRIVACNYGEITQMHIGLLGTMSALFLKDLADKTSRGLRGQIERGKSAGGLSFGNRYNRSLLVTDRRGNLVPEKGVLVIHPEEAATVLRIMQLYVAGTSAESIAKLLNKEKVRGPRGKVWSPSTINGNWRRGTGVLNNELYVGVRVWNRQKFLKDPDTRKRIPRRNPSAEWQRKQEPHLRIPGLTDELWQ
jgi:DNA invertase Pin-like site-specific DNA recombinase